MPKKTREEAVPIEITEGIGQVIEDFLGSREARELGFDNISDVVTRALQRLLEEHGCYPKKKAKCQVHDSE